MLVAVVWVSMITSISGVGSVGIALMYPLMAWVTLLLMNLATLLFGWIRSIVDRQDLLARRTAWRSLRNSMVPPLMILGAGLEHSPLVVWSFALLAIIATLAGLLWLTLRQSDPRDA